ncbi:hypothetical protein [Flavobacterium sp. UBA6135]|uniref:hypothetical protein n=1 Tax=Flavobacterium sp. UBA6135 TaxID=1946553 RepID=UPI0025C21E75|nr:hypothetical protein [Flavobacterium sp. UBA6135]
MKKFILTIIVIAFTNLSFGQKSSHDLKIFLNDNSNIIDVRDVLQFEGIEYMNLEFAGTELKNKSYQLTVKEIWNGKVKSETVVFDSKSIGIEEFSKVNDTILNLKVISKLTNHNKLKMTFKFPSFSFTKEYDAIELNEYSLRNLARESKLEIEYGKKFYLLAYILPYKREDGSKSWCEVGSNGKDIENWGLKYGIEHYLLFEMLFE